MKSGRLDPEVEDLKHAPKELLAREYIFVCAWRNSKLCKGICESFGIDQQYLDELHNDKNI